MEIWKTLFVLIALAQSGGHKRPASRMRPVDAQLFAAVRAGDIHGVRLALRRGANPNAREPGARYGNNISGLLLRSPTPLLALLEHMPITTPRVQHPAHPKVATPLPHTDFGSPADSDTLIGFGFTPENAAIARTLLAAGADPLLTDDTHIGPLVLALEEDKEETARLLIAYGADVNVPDHDGWTPLMYAIRNAGPKADPSVITEMLFERGVRVNDVAKDGETALELAEYQKDSLLIAKLKALGAVSHGAPTDRIHGTVPPD